MIVVWYKSSDTLNYRYWDVQTKGTFALEIRPDRDADAIQSYRLKSRSELESRLQELALELLSDGYVHLGHWDGPARLCNMLSNTISQYRSEHMGSITG